MSEWLESTNGNERLLPKAQETLLSGDREVDPHSSTNRCERSVCLGAYRYGIPLPFRTANLRGGEGGLAEYTLVPIVSEHSLCTPGFLRWLQLRRLRNF